MWDKRQGVVKCNAMTLTLMKAMRGGGTLSQSISVWEADHHFATFSGFSLRLTLYEHIKTAKQRTIIQQHGDWYSGLAVDGWAVTFWYNEEGPRRAAAPPIQRL